MYEERGDEISLVILDFEMPQRGGADTAIWIRDCEKLNNRRNVPIVGLTGHDDAHIRNVCLEAGMNEVMSKPIRKTDLKAMVAKYTEH